jgi:hypothetical protein
MPTLQLLRDAALTAAELLALLFVAPAGAAEPTTVHLHRVSTSIDLYLLGSLAGVRGAAPLAHELACAEELVDEDDGPVGHVQLTEDEAIADAQLTKRDGVAVLIISLPYAADQASLVVRPLGLPARFVELGGPRERPAWVVPVSAREATALPSGAVELELRRGSQVVWSTLQLQRTPSVAQQSVAVE